MVEKLDHRLCHHLALQKKKLQTQVASFNIIPKYTPKNCFETQLLYEENKPHHTVLAARALILGRRQALPRVRRGFSQSTVQRVEKSDKRVFDGNFGKCLRVALKTSPHVVGRKV